MIYVIIIGIVLNIIFGYLIFKDAHERGHDITLQDITLMVILCLVPFFNIVTHLIFDGSIAIIKGKKK